MKRIVGCVACNVLVLAMFAGCETYKPYTSPGATPPKLTRAAVMMEPNSKEKRRRADDIAAVLRKRGIEAVIVQPGEPVPKDVDGYFTYTDRWEWEKLEHSRRNAQCDFCLHREQQRLCV